MLEEYIDGDCWCGSCPVFKTLRPFIRPEFDLYVSANGASFYKNTFFIETIRFPHQVGKWISYHDEYFNSHTEYYLGEEKQRPSTFSFELDIPEKYLFEGN